MSVMVALAPLTPRTPSDIFAALALSPTVATGVPSSLPVLHFSPPTASSTSALSPFWPTSAATSSSPISSSGSQIHLPNIQHRALTSNEAKQLSMLLAQHLFPVRNSSKGLMKEAIDLAEKLHEAGIRWDTKRRVMGMHLRGIWEEGQRLGNVRSVGGHGPMDLYVQGSFLSIAEEPHPLDPMPIPLEVHPATFAALPKLTLQATSFHGDITPNLASMAVAMGAGLGLGMAGTGFATRSFEARGIDQDGEPPLSASSVMDLDDFAPTSRVAPTASQPTSKGGRKKGGWRDRKKQGLKIKVDAKLKSHHRPIPAMTPTSAFAAQLSSRGNTFAFLFNNLPQTSRPHSFKLSFTRALKKGVRKPKQGRPVNDVRAVDYAVADPPKAAGQASSMTDASNTGARSARRVSFGGWEVR